jgi:polyferredoxin
VVGSGFLDKWNGVPWKESASMKIDAVSGATLTSGSIMRTLQKRIALIDPSSASVKNNAITFTWKDAVIIILTLSGILLCTVKFKNAYTARYIQLALSVVFLGFITAACFSISLLFIWAKGSFPPAGSIGILFMVGAAILIPVLTGKNHHCFFVCPFGAFQELLFKIVPFKIGIKPQTNAKLRNIRYALLVMFAMFLLFNVKIAPESLEPFSAFMIKSAGWSTLVIAIVSLIAGIGINRPWCSFCCPAGAFLDELKRPKSGKNEC